METASKSRTNPTHETAGTSIDRLKMGIYAALFAALTAAGAYLAIPIGPVPIILQNMFVLLAGLMLGSKWGSISIGLYLFAGAIGFPVFSGGTGGIARLIGPTGGYLIGFLAAAYITGKAVEGFGDRWISRVAGMLIATLVVYGLGVSVLKWVTAMSWQKAFAVGVLPFLIGDGLKIAAAEAVYRMVSRQFPVPRP
uniref:Biotin transporter n=1 Tax=Desulfatirhabdium butyrativorans TaxID=340467 RepID=A0A7C4W0Z6_9BACT